MAEKASPGIGTLGGIGSVGTFQCYKGHYVLNLDVLQDQSRLNFYQPYLVIYEAGGQTVSSQVPGALSLLALVFCGPVGALMTILAAIRSGQEKVVAFWKTYSLNSARPRAGPLSAGRGQGHCAIASNQVDDAKSVYALNPKLADRGAGPSDGLDTFGCVPNSGAPDPDGPAGPSAEAGSRRAPKPRYSTIAHPSCRERARRAPQPLY